MSSIRATLRKKANAKGQYPIAIRITQNRKSSFLYIGQYIEKKFWDEKNNKVRKSHPNSARLNHLIIKKLAEANDKLIEADVNPDRVSASKIKKTIVSKNHSDFFSVAQLFLEDLKARKKIQRYQTELNRLELLQSFIGTETLAFDQLDVHLLKRFQAFLLKGGTRSQRTIANYMILLRTIYNLGISEGVANPKHYPFGKGKIQIAIPETQKIGLNKDEIILLENAQDLTPAQQQAVYVWLFSFYLAGIRVGDLLQLQWLDFVDGRLFYRMGKNSKLVSLETPQKAQAILNYFKEHTSGETTLIFPYLQAEILEDEVVLKTRIKTVTRSLNRRLEIVAEKVGINKKLSMHIARHSFGNISGDKIPIQMLQKLYRHSSITTTINYQQNFMHKETDEALDKVINF